MTLSLCQRKTFIGLETYIYIWWKKLFLTKTTSPFQDKQGQNKKSKYTSSEILPFSLFFYFFTKPAIPVVPFQHFLTTDHSSCRNKSLSVGGTGILVGNAVPEPAPPSSGTYTLLISNSGEKEWKYITLTANFASSLWLLKLAQKTEWVRTAPTGS